MYAETVVIYSDILFLINFSLDYLCLFISGRVLNCGGRIFRLILGSALGGLYSFIPYLFSMPVYISLPLHIATAFLITYISFGKRGAKKLLLLCGTFIVSSALLGGIITAVYSISSQYSNAVYTEVNAVSFCLICLFSALIALAYGLICRKKINIRSAEIRFYIGDDSFSARLLADSGNLVTEPFSALPVIIVTSAVLPPPYDSPESDLFPLAIRVIPFKTSSGSACYFGFRPDKIEIIRLARKPKVIDAFIGIDTANKNFSGYDGLLPASLL